MAQGVILGGEKPKLQIFVPPGYQDEQIIVGRCKVIVDADTQRMCGARFFRGQEQQWQTHVARCAAKHLDEIRRAAPSETNKRTIFDRNGRDLEVEGYMRNVVRPRMEREGRMEVLPSERAGHS